MSLEPSAAAGMAVPPRRLGIGGFLIARILDRLTCGSLAITLPDGRRIVSAPRTPGPEAVLVLHRWRTLRRLIVAGDIGFAEAYLDGDWSSPDITVLIELAARNQSSIPGATGGTLPSRLVQRLRVLARANTLAGSRRNIAEHYDLGNEFYARWLDAGMNYSSALFDDPDASLEVAQRTKQNRILQLLDLKPGQQVLEVGFGWGGLAERMAAEGCDIVGLTLSPAQHAYARARLRAAGLAARADLRLQDYREVDGRFDHIVSIEMLEAVGERWWPAYFAMLRDRLRPGGTIVLQCITIADERFPAYRQSAEFIQRYVFPGGMLPSPGALRTEIARAGLVVQEVETFGASYAQTLRLWQMRFQSAWPDIAVVGFSPHFKRLWEYYLSYCEAGFRTGGVDVSLWRLAHRT